MSDTSDQNVPSTEPSNSAVPEVPAAPAAPLPPENVLRGFLVSLIVLPVGVVLWLIIWNLGYIASIVALGVAFGAYWLYKKGSGGRISLRGAIIVAIVSVVTIVLAFFIGVLSDIAGGIAAAVGLSWGEVVMTPGFLGYAFELLAAPENAGALASDGAMAAIFGALGCAGVLFTAFREAKAQGDPTQPAPPAPPASPAA